MKKLTKILIIILILCLLGTILLYVRQNTIYKPSIIPVTIQEYGKIRIEGKEYIYFDCGNWLDFPLYKLTIGEITSNDKEIYLLGIRSLDIENLNNKFSRILSPNVLLLPSEWLEEGKTSIFTVDEESNIFLGSIEKNGANIKVELK